MDATKLADWLEATSETPASPKVDDPEVAALVDALTGGEKVASVTITADTHKAPEVPRLPLGATPRNPKGYPDEASYLAAQRRGNPMRTNGAERNSHRRWLTPVTTVREILENKDRSWQGNSACRRRRARQVAAATWYGVPNIILGS